LSSITTPAFALKAKSAQDALDAWVREVVAWHFDPATGTPFWLERAKGLSFDPRGDVQGYDDLDRFGDFQDEWLRGGPVRRWVPKGYADKPISIFETGGSTGVPKSRINYQDFRIDYSMFSETLPEASFPKGADWLHIGPSGPRRLRLATLTKEFFMPRFLERDEAEREPPCELYPWDGVRNVRPFSRFQATVVEGVY
jgi:hypothetical protein